MQSLEQKTEIDYIITNRPVFVTNVTVINPVIIGLAHRMVMSNLKLDVEVERKTLMTKRPPGVVVTQIGSKKTEFQLEPTSKNSNYIRRRNMGTHHPSKEQASKQTKMERRMLNIIYRDRKTSNWVREKTKVTDVIEQVRRWKWTWAGHVSSI